MGKIIVEVTISPTGEVSTVVKEGIHGPDCTRIVKQLTSSLGEVQFQQLKREFYENTIQQKVEQKIS